jgi:hypothetical protein
LDDKTKKKIFIKGSDYKKKLLEYIAPENLPKMFGGECNCEPYGCIFSNIGPWNTEGKCDVPIDKELAKKLISTTAEDTKADEVEGDVGDLEGVDPADLKFDEEEMENQEKLDELSKDLSEKMNIKGQKTNEEFRMQNNKGETPLNTLEV